MSYEYEELERKQKTIKNYWAFAYAKYCIEQEKKIEESNKAGFESLSKAFAGIFNPEDKKPERLQKAAEIIKAAAEVLENVKTIELRRTETRDKLEQVKKSTPDKMPETIKNNIMAACEAFAREKDKTKLAIYGACVREHIDALYEDPQLAAKVNLTEEQMKMATKIISVGTIIEEGLDCLERELINGVSPQNTISEDEHVINISKIIAMETVEQERSSGNILKQLQECDLVKTFASKDRFDMAAALSSKELRKSLAADAFKTIEPAKVHAPEPMVRIPSGNNS